MESVDHIDPVSNIQHLVDSIFRTLLPNESARKFFGIQGISEMISVYPGWYLWFDDKPGAYLLELTEAETTEDLFSGKDAAISSCEYAFIGHFRVKYFPSIEDRLTFESFSFYEQAVRLSDLFDDTGTPAFERNDEIPDTFFQVGNLDIRVSAGRNLWELCFSAPDFWMTFHPDGLYVGKEEGSTEVVPPGELDRNIPAWELSWFLVDRLISGLCYVYKTKPQCIALFEKEGIVYDIGSDCGIKERFSANVHQMFLIGCFLIPQYLHTATEMCFDLNHYKIILTNQEEMKDSKLLCFQDEPLQVSTNWMNAAWWHAEHFDVRETPPAKRVA